MLGPLLYLGALMALTGALTITENTVIDISECPMPFYQRNYTELGVNFTDTNVIFTFGGAYNVETSKDYIIGPTLSTNQVVYTKFDQDDAYESIIKQNVPTITTNMACYVQLDMTVNNVEASILLSNFSSQSALELTADSTEHVLITIMVNNASVERIGADTMTPNNYTDISGCRVEEGGIKSNTTSRNVTACRNVTCSLIGTVTSEACGDQERCDGDGICLVSKICSVVGPAVIDFNSKFNSSKDRCAYSLVSETELSISAKFLEQRRKDVNLVSSVTMHLTNPSTNITLAQDGVILVNNSEINGSELEVQGVLVFRNKVRILARTTLSRRHHSLYFNGSTAQLHMEVPVGSSPHGLCGNSSSWSSAKLSSESSTGCEIEYSEPPDDAINCTAETERCENLKKPPFSACNTVLDPNEYVSACSETMCKYPAKDGLSCQFMRAYARACSLKNDTLGDWRSLVHCSQPEPFCENRVCSDHEFCGMKNNGGAGCICRANFASRYKDLNITGDPMVCSSNSALISMVGCLLEEKNINYTDLHLKNETCKGEVDENNMVTFRFGTNNTCGGNITDNDSHITYMNTIMLKEDSAGYISRSPALQMNFSCIFNKPEMKTVCFKIKDNWVMQHITSGDKDYNVTVKAFADATHNVNVTFETEVLLDQPIWISVETNGLDNETVALVMDSCWVTDKNDSSSSPRYDLIQDGCANTADQTVVVLNNGNGTSCEFQFNMFRFMDGTHNLYIHLKLDVCFKDDKNCIPDCSGGSRRRRSVQPNYEPGASALLTMAWTY